MNGGRNKGESSIAAVKNEYNAISKPVAEPALGIMRPNAKLFCAPPPSSEPWEATGRSRVAFHNQTILYTGGMSMLPSVGLAKHFWWTGTCLWTGGCATLLYSWCAFRCIWNYWWHLLNTHHNFYSKTGFSICRTQSRNNWQEPSTPSLVWTAIPTWSWMVQPPSKVHGSMGLHWLLWRRASYAFCKNIYF